MSDYYDRAVEYFCERPDKTSIAWGTPDRHRFGQLFAYMSRDRGFSCGCPSQVRDGDVYDRNLSAALIRKLEADNRIPISDIDNGPHGPCAGMPPDKLRTMLTAFAEWQRRIDKELNRPEPVETSLAAKLYEARDTMRRLYGASWPEICAAYQGHIRRHMAKLELGELAAAQWMVAELQKIPETAATQARILAAVVEMIEPEIAKEGR